MEQNERLGEFREKIDYRTPNYDINCKPSIEIAVVNISAYKNEL